MKRKYFTEEERKTARNEQSRKYQEKRRRLKGIPLKGMPWDLEKRKNYMKEWGNLHKEENKIKDREYKNTHKQEIQERRKKNREKTNKLKKLKIKNNINFRISERLRSRLWKAIKNNQKAGSAVRDLGCSIPELKLYLESKFQEGMTWENYGYWGWHIDHIIPLDSFNLQNREEFLKACHYTNLQPLWAEENWKKNNRIIY